MDDGDDQVYKERMAKVDMIEKRLLSGHQTVSDEEEEELEDLENRNDTEKDDDNRPKLEHTNCVIDTGEYVELDSTTSTSSNLKLRVPASIWSRLYKFQKTGLKWMWELHVQKCGGILGDEMGLGKTVQMISYLASLSYSRHSKRSDEDSYTGLGPVLIITPVTVIAQWVREFHEWWPYLRVNVLHDIGTYQEPGSKTKLIEKTFASNGVLITTFSSLLIYDRV